MQEKPNILLILTDQQRWDLLGCYGASQCRTPHIDHLASRGVRFNNAFPLSICQVLRAVRRRILRLRGITWTI